MLVKVKDIMTKTSFRFFARENLSQCISVFMEKRLEGALVFNQRDELVGILTAKELLKGVSLGLPDISEIISPCDQILSEDDSIESVTHLEGIIFPVQNRKKEMTGFVTRLDILTKYGEVTQEKLSTLDAIFNSAHNGILSIDEKGYITSINPQAEKMAGTTREQAVGQFLTDVVVTSGLLEVVRTGKPHHEKYQAGKRKYITNRSPIFRNGQVIGAVGVFQDISEIEYVSQELSSVKEILHEMDMVMNSSYDGILITDHTGRIIKANQAFQRILGWDEQPENFKSLRGTYLESAIISSVLETKEMVTVIERNKCKNNLLFITATPVQDNASGIHRIVVNIRDITEIDNLRSQLEEAKRHLDRLENERTQNSEFISRSTVMDQVVQTVKMVARVDSTVLILGESGVGKEEICKLIHYYSERSQKPLVKVNCGAIPENLLESELFGYEAGAFTGANKNGKMGLFESANGGTLFLDEIGEIPLLLQVKLLRVLQEREFTRVGGVKPKKINVRIVAATNKDLKELVEKGQFREDLYYRLNVVPIQVPPLRERMDDIPALIPLFQKKFSGQYKMEKVFSSDSIQALLHYHWPGNVRELANVVERLFVTTAGPMIELKDVNMIVGKVPAQENQGVYVNGIIPLKEAIDEVEKQLITKAFDLLKNTRRTAAALGINQSTVVRKMQKFQKNENWMEGIDIS